MSDRLVIGIRDRQTRMVPARPESRRQELQSRSPSSATTTAWAIAMLLRLRRDLRRAGAHVYRQRCKRWTHRFLALGVLYIGASSPTRAAAFSRRCDGVALFHPVERARRPRPSRWRSAAAVILPILRRVLGAHGQHDVDMSRIRSRRANCQPRRPATSPRPPAVCTSRWMLRRGWPKTFRSAA